MFQEESSHWSRALQREQLEAKELRPSSPGQMAVQPVGGSSSSDGAESALLITETIHHIMAVMSLTFLAFPSSLNPELILFRAQPGRASSIDRSKSRLDTSIRIFVTASQAVTTSPSANALWVPQILLSWSSYGY